MARFVITDPSGTTQIFEIATPTVNIGRVDSNDVVLPHGSVSRNHARLSMLPGDIPLLDDLGSLNGTFVNGKQITEQRLSDQDRVGIGMFELKFESAGAQDFHLETAGGAVTDVQNLVGADDLHTALRRAPRPATDAAVVDTDRVRVLERENKLLKLLLNVGETLSCLLTPEEVMQRVMEIVFQMENVERGFVLLGDEEKGFKQSVVLCKDPALRQSPRGLALSNTVKNQVLSDRVPLLIHDVGSDQRFSRSESLRISGIRSAMCVPLIHRDRVFGLFYVDCLTKPYAFSKEELSILSVVAAEAAISFDNARAHEELTQRALEREAFKRFLSPNVLKKVLERPEEVQLSGKNLSVTVLFSDIRGFTRMSEHMEPQAVVKLLIEYFTEMTDVIFESEGTLDKYLGDGIMAVYGAPYYKPDDALRAAKTAMGMQRALARLNRKWQDLGQAPLAMGVGVNTGVVTAGFIGSDKRMDYTVIGDTVNLASRLCGKADGGQVLISESTFTQLNGSLPAQRLEPIQVKGKAALVERYELAWREVEGQSSLA